MTPPVGGGDSSSFYLRWIQVRIPIERVDSTGKVTGRGTARQRGVTIDDYVSKSGAELKLRPGEMFVVSVIIKDYGD